MSQPPRMEPAEGKWDPRRATFWGRFPTETGKSEPHAPTAALFETEDGEFFVHRETRTAPERTIATNPTRAITHGKVEVIDDPRAWLAAQTERLREALPVG